MELKPVQVPRWPAAFPDSQIGQGFSGPLDLHRDRASCVLGWLASPGGARPVWLEAHPIPTHPNLSCFQAT